MFPPKSPLLHRRLIAAALLVLTLGVHVRAQEKQPDTDAPTVTIRPVSDADLGYDLMHLEIIADGRLPSEGTDYGYRVVSVREQGNCMEMCPATPLYVVIGKISAKRDEKVKLYRIDGVRFMHFPKVTTLNPDESAGFFLVLRFTSMPHPEVTEHYVAKIGTQGATVERDGPDNPPPAHRFTQLLQRPGAGVFRIKLKDGNVFRLQEFEIFDPKTYGQADGWSASVVESGADNLPTYRMKAGEHFGPFLESEITEILDEGLNEIVYSSHK
jgi:hypothetical protein